MPNSIDTEQWLYSQNEQVFKISRYPCIYVKNPCFIYYTQLKLFPEHLNY